jgi:hypothetical protein
MGWSKPFQELVSWFLLLKFHLLAVTTIFTGTREKSSLEWLFNNNPSTLYHLAAVLLLLPVHEYQIITE